SETVKFFSAATKLLNSNSAAQQPMRQRGLLCPSQYTVTLGAEEHEQMSRSGGHSEAN
ncbi:hypothetical protein TNCV_408591, partial [Trichonephila clavipes]